MPSSNSRRLARRLAEDDFQIPPDLPMHQIVGVERLLDRFAESVARENVVFPVHMANGILYLASADPENEMLADKLRFIQGTDVRLLPASKADILDAINACYGMLEGESADSMLQEFTDTAVDFTETEADDNDDWSELSIAEHELSDWCITPTQKQTYKQTKGYCDPPRFRRTTMATIIGQGERALVYKRDGTIDVVIGPKRLRNWTARIVNMQHYIAGPSEYIRLRKKDGGEETIPGPSEVWLDPRVHESVRVEDCLVLSAKEAVVVYRSGSENADDSSAGDQATASRRIVGGPGLFVPEPGEWLHRFSWHASDGGSRGAEKRPNALQFEKLLLMPDQMYHDVPDVRTADDAVLKIRLMIFFELVDIERMLDTTRDPIGDFINAATSDVVEFTCKHSFDEFKQCTDQLNELSTYSQLMHRAKQCGYQINNVVYRGYGAPDSLQKMHDDAIQSRTKLALEKETERQAQELEDYKLRCQMERNEQRRSEQLSEAQHDLEVKREQSNAEIGRKRIQNEFETDSRKARREMEIELQTLSDRQREAHLSILGDLNVDLTKFLTQGSADQVIELRGDSHTKPHVHLT